jgi:hypothetical protein
MPVLQHSAGQRLSTAWGEFAAQAPELAEFGALRLTATPAYLATVDDSGAPRVHPVTPIVGDGRLFLLRALRAARRRSSMQRLRRRRAPRVTVVANPR